VNNEYLKMTLESQHFKLAIMTKKKELLIILSVSTLLSTIGMFVDTDPGNLSTWTMIFEYFAMLTITFASLSLIYYGVTFSFKKVKGLVS